MGFFEKKKIYSKLMLGMYKNVLEDFEVKGNLLKNFLPCFLIQ